MSPVDCPVQGTHALHTTLLPLHSPCSTLLSCSSMSAPASSRAATTSCWPPQHDWGVGEWGAEDRNTIMVLSCGCGEGGKCVPWPVESCPRCLWLPPWPLQPGEGRPGRGDLPAGDSSIYRSGRLSTCEARCRGLLSWPSFTAELAPCLGRLPGAWPLVVT